MSSIPGRVSDRLTAGLKKFQPIIQSAKQRDVNESDTVIIVTDMLSELFGYDKYSEITSEFAIRGTFCDLATKIDGHVQCIIEVKAAGTELKESHTKQAVDYAANQGVDWVALTNSSVWKVYKVNFTKPICQELVLEFDIVSLNYKKAEDINCLFLVAKEGFVRSALGEFSAQKQALNRFFIAATVLTDTVLDVVRRELRRMSPDVRIDTEQIHDVLVQEVLKRDVIEGEKADEARKKVARAANKALKAKAAAAGIDEVSEAEEVGNENK
jgi:Type I restriction enzyme R protein N terminus (HSDR_N)